MTDEAAKRLERLKKAWKKTPAASTGQGSGQDHIPPGKYQAIVIGAKLDKDYKVYWTLKVCSGEYTGKKIGGSGCRNDLLYERDGDPIGLSYFKANLVNLGLELEEFDRASLARVLKAAIGIVAEVSVRHRDGYQNVFINGHVTTDTTEESSVPDADVPPIQCPWPSGTHLNYEEDGKKYLVTCTGDLDDDGSVIVTYKNEQWSVPAEELTYVEKQEKKPNKKVTAKTAEEDEDWGGAWPDD